MFCSSKRTKFVVRKPQIEHIMLRTVFIIFLSIFCSITLAAQDASPYVASLPEIPAKDVGIYIEDLRTGDVVLDVNGEKLFTPASVTKLVTSSTALNLLNPDACFSTDVEIDGQVKKDVLEGNIVIKACGDPTIESKHFPENKGFAAKVASAVKQRGITCITGKVKVDYPKVLEQSSPIGWMEEDFVWAYGTEFHAVNYADNVIAVRLPSGGTSPETPGVIVRKSDRNFRARGSKVIETRGSQQLANPYPESTLCNAVVEALNQLEIEVGKKDVALTGKSELLLSHKSPQFGSIITSLMYRSDNLMAEAMLRATAPGAARDEAVKQEVEFWNAKGIDTDGLVIEDGSGLSRNNRLTPYFLAEVLDWMRLNKNKNGQYVNIFPVAGRSGTMRTFLKGTELEGKIVAKTGSMRNVQCYAGFKIDDNGQPTHLVVVMLNNFSDRAKLKKALEKLLLQKLL